MLRLLALALLLANLLYFTWTLGWLDAVVGVPALGEREPERLQRQLQPELVQLTPVDAAGASATSIAAAQAPAASEEVAAASAPASAAPAVTVAAAASVPPPAPASAPAKAEPADSAAPAVKLVCVEAGPFDANALAEAETALRAAVPSATWTQRRVAGSGEWMIYMGPYPDDAWVERKKAELSRIRGGLAYDVVGPTPQFGRGISLGRFTSQADAEKQLEALRPRGIRTARVIQSGEGPGKTALRFAKADPALLERLAAVQWPAGQNGPTPCPASR